MFNTFKTCLLSLVVAAALMPGLSAASTVSVSGAPDDDRFTAIPWIAHQRIASLPDSLPDFLMRIVSQSSAFGAGPVRGISFNADPGLPEFLLSDAARRNPLSVNLRRSVDLSLWNLVAAVHAQQRGDAFELVEASVASLPLSQPNVDPLSTVPLPPAVWLFVMGALGLAGTRITGLSGGARKVGDPTLARDLSRNFGGALPA